MEAYTFNRESVREQGRHEAAGLKKWWFFRINYIFHLSKFWDVRIRCEIIFLLFWMLVVYYGLVFPLTENLAFNGGDLVDSEWQVLACCYHVSLAGLTFTSLILISKISVDWTSRVGGWVFFLAEWDVSVKRNLKFTALDYLLSELTKMSSWQILNLQSERIIVHIPYSNVVK